MNYLGVFNGLKSKIPYDTKIKVMDLIDIIFIASNYHPIVIVKIILYIFIFLLCPSLGLY